jgi:hypothetical protein
MISTILKNVRFKKLNLFKMYYNPKKIYIYELIDCIYLINSSHIFYKLSIIFLLLLFMMPERILFRM